MKMCFLLLVLFYALDLVSGTALKDFSFEKEKEGQSFLLVTSHPDDEAMFFSSLLSKLQQLNLSVSILCLSTGNDNNRLDNSTRVEELYSSLQGAFGISGHHVTVLNHDALQDSLNSDWDPEVISPLIVSHVKRLGEQGNQVDVIVSFDKEGVSGHPNHVSTSKGAEMARNTLNSNSFNSISERKCKRKSNDEEEKEESCEGVVSGGGVKVKGMYLLSLPWFLKYSGALAPSLLSQESQVHQWPLSLSTAIMNTQTHTNAHTNTHTSGAQSVEVEVVMVKNPNPAATWTAMALHASQWEPICTYYRRAFVLMSSYTYVNYYYNCFD